MISIFTRLTLSQLVIPTGNTFVIVCRYAEKHDPEWIEWYRSYYDALYGPNKDPVLLKKIDKVYPGPPRGFDSAQKRSDHRGSDSKSHVKERRGKSREKYEEKAEKGMKRRPSSDQSHKKSDKERGKTSRKEKTSKKKEGRDKKKEKRVVDKTDEDSVSSMAEREHRLSPKSNMSKESTEEAAQTISTVIGITSQKFTMEQLRPQNLTRVVTNHNIRQDIDVSDSNLSPDVTDDNLGQMVTDNKNLTLIQVVSDTDLNNAEGALSIPEALSVEPPVDRSEAEPTLDKLEVEATQAKSEVEPNLEKSEVEATLDKSEVKTPDAMEVSGEKKERSKRESDDPSKNICDIVLETDNKPDAIPTAEAISSKEKEFEEEKDELPNIETASVKEKKKDVTPEKEERKSDRKKIKRKDVGKTGKVSGRHERRSTDSQRSTSPKSEAVAVGKTSNKSPSLPKSEEYPDALPNTKSLKSDRKQKHIEQSSKMKSEQPRKRKLEQKHDRKRKHAKHSQTETKREEKRKPSNSDLSDSYSESSDSDREARVFTKPLELKAPVKSAYDHNRREIPPSHTRLDRKPRAPGPTETKRNRVVHRGEEQTRHRKTAVVKNKQPAFESEDSELEDEVNRKKGSVCSRVVKGPSPEPPPPGTEDAAPLHSHSPSDFSSDDDRTPVVTVKRPSPSRWEREDFDSSSPRPRDRNRKVEKKAPLPK